MTKEEFEALLGQYINNIDNKKGSFSVEVSVVEKNDIMDFKIDTFKCDLSNNLLPKWFEFLPYIAMTIISICVAVVLCFAIGCSENRGNKKCSSLQVKFQSVNSVEYEE